MLASWQAAGALGLLLVTSAVVALVCGIITLLTLQSWRQVARRSQAFVKLAGLMVDRASSPLWYSRLAEALAQAVDARYCCVYLQLPHGEVLRVHPQDDVATVATWRAVMEEVREGQGELTLRLKKRGLSLWGRPLPVRDTVLGSVVWAFHRRDARAATFVKTVEMMELLLSVAGWLVERRVFGEREVVRVERSRILTRGQEEERRRVARELHDGVAQQLAGALALLEVGADSLSSDSGEASRMIGLVQQELRKALEEIRLISRSLHPAMLEHLGLVATLKWYLEELARQTGLSVSCHLPHPSTRLPSAVELAVFRVVQEALNNVRRHAGATHVWVDLRVGERVEVTIADNGRGFDPTLVDLAAEQGHLGLLTMRERVEQVGGSLLIDTAPQRGTKIHVSVPVGVAGTAEAAPILARVG